MPAGNYNFTFLDSNNCTFNQLIALSDSGATISAIQTDLTCYEIANGAIDISILGGTSPFSYNWIGPSINTTILNSQNLQNITELLSGAYGVNVTDSIGCVYANVTNLQQPDSISIIASVNNASCFGAGNGNIDISISGGTPNYSASWSALNGNTFLINVNGEDISSLQPDTYNVIITDANNCINNKEFTIAQPDALSVSAVVNNITCNNANDGAINTTAFGGIQPYQFSWSGGIVSANQNINNLAAGQYNLTIIDSNNCSFDTLFTIINPSAIAVSTTIVNSICLQANGSAVAIATGGTIAADYDYSWIDSDNNILSNQANLSAVPAGIYQINILDDNNCLGTSTVAISDSNGSIQSVILPVNCVDSTSGEINITVLGASGSIVYLWGNPLDSISSNEDLVNLAIGTYSITATDSIGCVFTSTYNLSAPSPIDATAILSNLNCFNDESGAIDITISGGFEPFEIRWNNSLLPFGQQDLLNLEAGIYALNITDALGCVYENSYTINQNPLLGATLDITQPSCLIDTLGSISGNIQGGVAPYTINWSGPNGFASNQINIASLEVGIYCLDITDSAGCNFDTCVTIESQSQIIIQVDTVVTPFCYNSSNGSIEITTTGTIGNILYAWILAGDTVATTEDISDIPSGTYTLVVADDSGCEKFLTVQVDNNDSIAIDATINDALCFGSETGSIELNITGGVPDYSFQWTGNGVPVVADSTLLNITSGEYIVVVTDANDCQLTDTIIVTELTSFDITSVVITDAQCSNDTTGAITISATGGTADFSFSWIGLDFNSSAQNINNILPGDYTITITDFNNCVADSTIAIGYLFEISANAGLDTTLCPENFPLILVGAGVNNTASSWVNLNGEILSNDSSLSFTNAINSDTLIYIAINSACSASDTVIVTTLPFAVADAGLDQTIFGDQEFTLGGSPAGENAVSYLWQPNIDGSLDSTISNPVATISESTLFTLTIVDENGCVNTDSTFITRIPTIVFFNGITPNGDGKNDDWTIHSIELFPNNQVEIYNRWGDMLFQQKPYENAKPWVGKFEGKDLPIGTYYYIINLNDAEFPDAYTGPITILR